MNVRFRNNPQTNDDSGTLHTPSGVNNANTITVTTCSTPKATHTKAGTFNLFVTVYTLYMVLMLPVTIIGIIVSNDIPCNVAMSCPGTQSWKKFGAKTIRNPIGKAIT